MTRFVCMTALCVTLISGAGIRNTPANAKDTYPILRDTGSPRPPYCPPSVCPDPGPR